MTLIQQSTVIFVHSTAHWEAIQRQRAQLLSVSSPNPSSDSYYSTSSSPAPVQKKSRSSSSSSSSAAATRKYNIGNEGSRRRNRWTNSKYVLEFFKVR
jgi:hypothetical protein